MVNVEQTIISQYANSPTLVQLVQNMNGYIDPQADFDNFYAFVWNVRTAQAWGLDILGRLVNVSRQLQIPASVVNFGYNEGLNYQPFGQAPFYVGVPTSNTYLLSDNAYRTLILMKALLNISNSTAPAINQLLKNLFAGRGRCYVTDTGQMQIRFVFEFPLLPYEIAILTQSNAVPRPVAVLAQVMQLDLPTTFGFNEAKVFQPFGQGAFFNSSTGLITAN
jgi:hypothetical protein